MSLIDVGGGSGKELALNLINGAAKDNTPFVLTYKIGTV